MGFSVNFKCVVSFVYCFVGGESVPENCQILQTRVNRYKSDKQEVDSSQLEGYSCDIKFSGMLCYFS